MPPESREPTHAAPGTDALPAPAASAPPPVPDLTAVPGLPTAAQRAAAGDVAVHAVFQRRRAYEGTERRALDRRVAAVVEGMSDAFLAIGPDWRVRYANREAARLSGTTAEALVGRSHAEQWPHTVGSEVERRYRQVIAERVPAHFDFYYEATNTWHEIRAYPADDGGVAVFYRDVTAQRLLEAERARQARELADAHDKALAAETQFRLLVDRVQDYAVFLCDPDGIITYWGPGAERMKGWTAAEAIGKHLRELYPDGGVAEDGSADDHLRYAALHGEYIGEGRRVRRGVEPFAARVVLTALRRGGQLAGFSEIAQDLSGERRHAQALADAVRASEAASVAKSQFLANTSHEIRTPLNAVMGYAALLDAELAGPLSAQQRQYVARIQDTSQHLLALVNDVLDLSKIEAGRMWAAREPALVHPAIASALRLVEPLARTRRVATVHACRDAALAYRGDAERVGQILVNLLSNAVRFTEVGGRVTVTCGRADAAPAGATLEAAGPVTFVRVEDTGVGIAPDQLERIWDAFVQGDATRTRRVGGSGLGLTISRHLARLMGGDITVASRQDLGSTFVLWLPAAEAHEVPAGAVGERGASAALPQQAPEAALDELDPAEVQGLDELSSALLSEVERVLATTVARLRVDAATPSAHTLPDAQLEDHLITFLVDVAQCLSMVSHDGAEAAQMLRDGSAIQQLIARRHGAQRARLGWAEAEVRRELQTLREEVHAAVHRRVTRGGSDAERAPAILNHFFAQAEHVGLESFRAERDGPRPAVPPPARDATR